MAEDIGVIDSDVVNLGKDDAALVFRQETEDVEVFIPGGSVDDHRVASTSVMLATYFAYACSSDNPEIRKAVRTIMDTCDKEMEKWLRETGKRK